MLTSTNTKTTKTKPPTTPVSRLIRDDLDGWRKAAETRRTTKERQQALAMVRDLEMALQDEVAEELKADPLGVQSLGHLFGRMAILFQTHNWSHDEVRDLFPMASTLTLALERMETAAEEV